MQTLDFRNNCVEKTKLYNLFKQRSDCKEKEKPTETAATAAAKKEKSRLKEKIKKQKINS